MPEAVLEFKAKDGAWYAGTAAFEGPFLRVHFEHFPEEEDELWLPQKFKSPSDVRKVIRPASQPLQDYQCGSLRRGIFLCAAYRHPNSEFFEYYDAKLQQINRSPHDLDEEGLECCRCKFEVEWLGGPLAHRREFVSCGDICLRTHGDIEDDPVIKEYLAEVKKSKDVLGNEIVSTPNKSKEYLGAVTNSKDALEKDAVSTLKKRKATSFLNHKREPEPASSANCNESASKNDVKGLDTSLQCGESSNQIKECSRKKEEHMEGQPFKKTCLNNMCTRSSEPPIIRHILADSSNFSIKQPVNVIQIDSDNEEDCKPSPKVSNTQPCTANDASATKSAEDFVYKPSSRVNHAQSGSMNDGSTTKSAEGFCCSKLDTEAVSHKASPSWIGKSSSHHGFSGISKEQTFSFVDGMAACSYVTLPRHCFNGDSYQYEAVGFIPVTPFCVAKMYPHSECSNRKVNSSCIWQSDGYNCTHSATSHVCSKNIYSQTEKSALVQDSEDKDDIKQTFNAFKANNREYFCENVTDNGNSKQMPKAHKANDRQSFSENMNDLSYSQFLLVENMEKDVMPSKALKIVQRVTCGALMVYIWPSMDYETSRRGYICYQDSAAAKVAYEKFSAGMFVIASSKGRPWIVSQVRPDKFDRFQMYYVSAAVASKEEDTEDNEAVGNGDLWIVGKGTEEFPLAKGKQRLFLEQQNKLRSYYQKFVTEEEELEAKQCHGDCDSQSCKF